MARCECLDYPATPLLERFGLGIPAWRLQQRGYAVLPLARGQKKPHRMLPWSGEGKDGVHHASLEEVKARGWWGNDPAANVGVATGSVSRLVVIDLDVKKGHDGPAVFWRFLVEHELGELPAPTVQTPSGGLHLWLRTPAGVAVPERPGILPGVDVKGDGGLVVAPPSMVLGIARQRPGEPLGTAEAPVPYTWAAGCPCAVPGAPPWLLPWLASAPSGSPAGSGEGETGQAPDLTSLKRTGIPRGQRNAELYRLACSLFRRRGTSTEASLSVKEDLMEIWSKSDRSEFSASELLTVIDSARRFVEGRQEEDKAVMDRYGEWMSRGERQ
jgi:hypothetical protein